MVLFEREVLIGYTKSHTHSILPVEIPSILGYYIVERLFRVKPGVHKVQTKSKLKSIPSRIHIL